MKKDLNLFRVLSRLSRANFSSRLFAQLLLDLFLSAGKGQQQSIIAIEHEPVVLDLVTVRRAESVEKFSLDIHSIVLDASSHCRDDIGDRQFRSGCGKTSATNITA